MSFAAPARTLKIGYVPSTLFAPLFVAIDRGYLAAEGFDVAPSPILAGQDAVTLLSLGTLDIAAGGLSAAFFNAVSRGLDVRYVASLAYQPARPPASVLLVRSDLMQSGEVRKPADLRGRAIAWIGGLGATSTFYVERILETGKLTVRDVRIVNMTLADSAAALANKAIDAVFTSSPFTEEFVEKKLAEVLAPSPAGISATGLFFGVNLLRDHATGAAVIRAVRKAAAEIAGAGYTKPQTLATLAKYANISPDLVSRAARYRIEPSLRVDTKTLLEMQILFLGLKVLSYETPLRERSLVETF